MRDFRAILKELKLYMACGKKQKIYDKDVAIALGISQMNFATIKRRNTTPYENILKFCQKEGVCCSDIFFTKS